ncbi:hypothetical protein A3J78_00930, partial [Candidatus Beckwithbacteria bacterium RBG_13_35_6]
MPYFNYIATSKTGQLKRGAISTSSEEQVRKLLAVKGYKLISCEQEEGAGQLFSKDIRELLNVLFNRKVSILDKISFAHHMSVMLKAGVPIIEAVDVLAEDISSYKFRSILKELRGELEAGRNLSSLLEKEQFFSKAHLAILKSGEASGDIDEALVRISMDLNRDYAIAKKIKGAMAYPSIVMLALVLVSGFIMVFVLPKVGEVFKQMRMNLPLPTVILLAVGSFISKYFIQVLIVLLLVIGLLIVIFKTTDIGKKFLGLIMGKLPYIKQLVKEISMARFIRALSSLLSSGVPIAKSLEISGEVFVTSKYQQIVKDAVAKVEKGVALSAILRSYRKEFDGILIKMCSVGERSGKLAEILDDVALFYEREVDNKLENISSI